ncbi:hypothetical protein SY88_05040 [Clostridiales bacterium PH28_bin88]|nr:hypothetical protein SY88_05040 [Clostridiales bacterium PH28_bin88]
MRHQVEKALQDLGFTGYEAATYLALVLRHPATGYELSKSSGVPQAKVYETLPRLVERGAVVGLGGDPVKYVPIPPRQLIKKLRESFEHAAQEVETGLARLRNNEFPKCALNFMAPQIIPQVREMLGRARREAVMLAPSGLLNSLEKEVRELQARGVTVRVSACPSGLKAGFAGSLTGAVTPFPETGPVQHLLLLVDDREVLMGQDPLQTSAAAVWTENPAVVELIRELAGLEPGYHHGTEPRAEIREVSVETPAETGSSFGFDFFAPGITMRARLN